MSAFIVLGLVFSLTCQVIGWDKHLWNGLLLCHVGCKTFTQSVVRINVCWNGYLLFPYTKVQSHTVTPAPKLIIIIIITITDGQRILMRGHIAEEDWFLPGKSLWHQTIGSNAVGCSSHVNAVIDFLCCVHCSSDLQCFSLGMLFSGQETSRIAPFLLEIWMPV